MNTGDFSIMVQCNLNELNNTPKEQGIYFLFNDIELIYIGQTNNLRKRLTSHDIEKNLEQDNICELPKRINNFNHIYYLSTNLDTNQRIQLEKEYIDSYFPKYNEYGEGNIWYYQTMKKVEGEQ